MGLQETDKFKDASEMCIHVIGIKKKREFGNF